MRKSGRLRNYLMTGIEQCLNANFDLGDVRNELNVGFRLQWERQKRLQEKGDLPGSRDGVLAEHKIRKNFAYSGFNSTPLHLRQFCRNAGRTRRTD